MLLNETALVVWALIYTAVGITVATLLPERRMYGDCFITIILTFVFWPIFVATILIALMIKKVKEGITNVIKKRMP